MISLSVVCYARNAVSFGSAFFALQDPLEFYGYLMPKLEALKMDSAFLNRNVNEGFSGGEKKRNEVRPPHPAVLATASLQRLSVTI
jgi:Fe-S cluster assembly ATPase SufC